MNNNKIGSFYCDFKKRKKGIIFIIILLLVILYLIFQNIYLGYEIKTIAYSHSGRNINIGIPKMSFVIKNNDHSYSFKNLRNFNIIEKEIMEYLKSLQHSTCHDMIYYYDEKEDFSIIHYSIKNHILYHTISYEIVEKDYCFTEKMRKYSEKLNGLKRYHTLNGGGFSLSEDKEFTPRLVVSFLDDIDIDRQEITATLEVSYLTPISNEWKVGTKKIIEKSSGIYEIKNDKLYYYRTDISEKAKDISIPEVSVFQIDDGNLILTDTYLSAYESNVILK